jgi:GH24 family phage-related lysozyme (muramidase)
MIISQDQANVLLALDTKKAGDAVLRLTKTCTQGQLDALTDFAFNLGINALAKSTLLKFHNQGRFDLAAGQFHLWVHDNGKVLPGLVTRREKERTLYVK